MQSLGMEEDCNSNSINECLLSVQQSSIPGKIKKMKKKAEKGEIETVDQYRYCIENNIIVSYDHILFICLICNCFKCFKESR